LTEQVSTDVDGIAQCLGLKAEVKVDLEVYVLKSLENTNIEKTSFKLRKHERHRYVQN
jgi:hypothetical protein